LSLDLSPEVLSTFSSTERKLIRQYGDQLTNPALLAKIEVAKLNPPRPESPAPTRPVTGLPAGIAAVCLVCRTEFKSEFSYLRHRDMSVPFAARACRGAK
jgi:hypothetical protein